MRCLRLPFGYVDSPRCFCAMTEAVAQKFRERVARALVRAHIFVYVDDALVVGDTEEDTRAASRILEALLAELGLQWAPHKRRGPAQVIEFLGLLLCNHARAPRCIALTRRRQSDLRARLDAWLARRPARGSAGLEVVDPRELAVLLGNLVFASQVMPNARVYLQGMLASFIGLEVEWKRGKVRVQRGAWRSMTLSDAFWRDLEWWDQQLETNNCVSISPTRRARAAVQAGTDASDFGAGELIYLGGQREETRLKFTRAEQRRPINWRELLGIFRVVEVWGERLRGCRLLVETDNTVAWATGSSGHSKAAEMQELLRRLCEACARFEIELGLTHQPGVKLDRPDQVSRGSAAEEPRARLCRALFETVAARFGPFSEFLGAEREFAVAVPAGGPARCFVHSSHSTVGSALRLVGERLRDSVVGNISGVVVVPYAPEALWWKLTKHFAVVAHLNNSRRRTHLEANTLSAWRPLPAQRESLILAYPRSAGNKVLSLQMDWCEREPEETGYVLVPPMPRNPGGILEAQEAEHADLAWPGVGRRYVLPTPRGAFVYSKPRVSGDFGGLYQLAEDYFPTTDTDSFGPRCYYLLRDSRANAKAACPGRIPVLIDSAESLASSPKGAFFQPDGDELYLVTHLVERVTTPASRSKGWHKVTDYFYFNAAAAEREILALERRLDGVGSRSVMSVGELSDGTAHDLARSLVDSCASLTIADGAAASATAPALPVGILVGAPDSCVYDGLAGSSADPPKAAQARGEPTKGSGIGPAPPCGFEGCTARCSLLADQGGYSTFCTGEVHPASPRPICELVGCQSTCHPSTPDYSGWYRYCGRTHGQIAEKRRLEAADPIAERSMVARSSSGAGTIQVARSDGILCRGCLQPIRMGSKMEVFQEGFIHPSYSCRVVATGRQPVRHIIGDTLVPFEDVVAQTTPMAHNLQKQARVAEQLSSRRMAAMRACMDGNCPMRGRPEAEAMLCRGGCGRTLHGACAEISKGYLLKGAFTCYHCRLNAMGAEGQPHDALCLEVCRQVAVELTEGRESTSATHCAFVTLSEKWVAEMLTLGLTRVASPTENAESFRQFARWMVTTAGRERSMRTTMRAAAGYFEAAGKTNFTKMPAVKALLRQLDDMIGTESQPTTHGTRRMLLAALSFVSDRWSNKPFLRVRETALLINESVGCLRATEACSAIEKHGLSANDCFVLQNRETNEVTVELRVHDSKCHLARWVNMAGETTTSKVDVAGAYLDLFKTNNLTLSTRREGKFSVISPDSYSVKLSLLGVTDGYLELLDMALLDTFRTLTGKAQGTGAPWNLRARLIQYADQAKRASTGGATHKYVLLNEGPRQWRGHSILMANLEKVGLGKIDADIHLVPAPLLRATHMSGRVLTPMPLTYDTAHASMKLIFEHAVKAANPPGDPDPEFDLQGHAEAHWGQHSWRRMGEKTARDDMPQLMRFGLTKDDIDLYSGWEGKKLSENMQIHYAGQDRDHRVKRCAITRST